MNFIIKEDKEIFRNSLNSINNGLYLELENIAKKAYYNAKKPLLKRSMLSITEDKMNLNNFQIEENWDFEQKAFQNKMKNIEVSKLDNNVIEASPILKHHSDVDALIMALRKKREINSDSNEKTENESNFDQFIKNQLHILHNKAAGRNAKRLNCNNRSMDINDSSNHPFLTLAKMKMKEVKFTPVIIRSNNKDNNKRKQIKIYSSLKKEDSIYSPLESNTNNTNNEDQLLFNERNNLNSKNAFKIDTRDWQTAGLKAHNELFREDYKKIKTISCVQEFKNQRKIFMTSSVLASPGLSINLQTNISK